MKSLDVASFANDYLLRFSISPIYECALDIASFTWTEVHGKLEKSLDEIHQTRERIRPELQMHVRRAGEVHSWRNLLFLAHRCPHLYEDNLEEHVDLLIAWIQSLGQQLKAFAAPYLGRAEEAMLRKALQGDTDQQTTLLERFESNPVVARNIAFLFHVDADELASHVCTLLRDWYDTVMVNRDAIIRALAADLSDKQKRSIQIPALDLVRLATKGSDVNLSPGVETLWLIPQMTYRPFTILNSLPDCRVYYYPISPEYLPQTEETADYLMVASLYKAVGDVNRILMLSHLRQSEKTLQELAELLDMPKSTVHHHLTLLKSVGLVRVESGVYHIQLDAVENIHRGLWTLLGLQGERS